MIVVLTEMTFAEESNEALRALDHFGSRAAGLREAAEFMLRRTN